jgi:hypothetical protein
VVRVRVTDAVVGARFLLRLPSFLRHPLDVREARAIRARRLERRDRTFLANVGRAVYGHAASPYRRLLESIGCEYGDLERLVEREGVEGTLTELCAKGVYLTVDEFKGRRPVTRGSTTIPAGPDLLRNPSSSFHLAARSGGSRSSGTPVLIDLAFIRGCGVNTSLLLDAWGDDGWHKAVWETPGAGARFRLLKFSSFGPRPSRWFSQIDPAAHGLDAILRWSERAMRWGSRVARVPLPPPEFAPLDAPLPIAHWAAAVRRAGDTPFIFTFPSSAVHLCRAALDHGVDLRGARFLLGGEPITAARLAVLREVGAEALPRYGSMECGPVGYGCLAPSAPDDVHLLHDMHALIRCPTPVREARGLPEGALFISSLHPEAPFVMLNVSMGDQAVLEQRACGCPLDRLGYGVHLHTIRSYEKLTGEGVTFLDADVIRVLESELPARFGGAPTDYQLVEDEAEDGRARVRLFVHPRVGPLEPSAIAEAFLVAVGSGSPAARVMERVWRDADLLQVERQPPLTTRAGKVLHLHRRT